MSKEYRYYMIKNGIIDNLIVTATPMNKYDLAKSEWDEFIEDTDDMISLDIGVEWDTVSEYNAPIYPLRTGPCPVKEFTDDYVPIGIIIPEAE
jgi:hypothetical protein